MALEDMQVKTRESSPETTRTSKELQEGFWMGLSLANLNLQDVGDGGMAMGGPR